MQSRVSLSPTSAPNTVPEQGLCAQDVRRVESWVRRLGGPGCDVEDLVQEVLVAAWRGREKFRGEAKLGTWLFRITEKVVFKKRRSEGRFRRWLKRSEHEEGQVAYIRGPSEEFERDERVRLLYKALDRLSEGYRTPLILFELEGMGTDEIGVLLNCTPNSVRVKLHRGRALLFEALSSLQGAHKGGAHE